MIREPLLNPSLHSTVLPSVVCGVSCDGHNKYDPSTSSTAVNLGRPFVLAYLTGDVEGEQFADNVAIGGYTVIPMGSDHEHER